MLAHHPHAPFWIRNGLFDALSSFTVFEERVNAIPEQRDREAAFTLFIDGYLATQPIAQSSRHWLTAEVPPSLRKQYGIPPDRAEVAGIYESHDGGHIAYQTYFRKDATLTAVETAPFLGATERFARRVIFTNVATVRNPAIRRTRWVSRVVLRELSITALHRIEASLKGAPEPASQSVPDPRFQVQALADIERMFSTHDRTNVVMPSGVGKTRLAIWAAERLQPSTVLVLVPTLTLLKQTIQEWNDHSAWGKQAEFLCVCADTGVGLQDDMWAPDASEMGFHVDTDPSVVRSFLKRRSENHKIIFSTYQSCHLVGEGAKGLPPIDLGIFDEAHKTMLLTKPSSTYALADTTLAIHKRLFLTATPRKFDIRQRDKEGELRISSIETETVYGPRAHSLTFAAAARMGFVRPYKVLVAVIDKPSVDAFARSNGIPTGSRNESVKRSLAGLLALMQALERVDARKIVTFHSHARLAEEFAQDGPRGMARHANGHLIQHVNGGQDSLARGEAIRQFARAERSILTNAKCLTDGVNIPGVDMVAFVDPRQSRVDIARSVARAIRKPFDVAGPLQGYILVPLFINRPRVECVESALKDDDFDIVADVFNALQEHDEDLVSIVREIRECKGLGTELDLARLGEKVDILGSRIAPEVVLAKIGAEIANRIGTNWDELYGALVRYWKRKGHCRVPAGYVDRHYKLGAWVSAQRWNVDSLSAERKQRLDFIPFEWDPLTSDWEGGLSALKAFRARTGHCQVPKAQIEDGFKLGRWASVQRASFLTISDERRRQLDELGFVW